MCGFFGWIGPNLINNSEILHRVSEAIMHRGPDDSGQLVREHFGLGFRRLSIIDLSQAGHQPMSTSDGAYHIVFNGEIYNYKEFLPELSRKGVRFVGHSDTEVLLYMLSVEGKSSLSKLNGMFAFCFVDEQKGTFLIARDRLGVKPLYYTISNGRLFFSSELTPLLHFPIESLDIDLLSLNRYLHFGHIAPPQTIYQGIKKLEPGSYIEGRLQRPEDITIKKWWSLEKTELNHSRTAKQLLDETDALLDDATKIRLIADVPIGLFLSGGIDSSLVACYASRQNNKPVALSVTFDESEYSELDQAKLIAKHLGLDLITVPVRSGSLAETPQIISHVGEPFDDSSIVNQYNLARESRKYATVFLTGDGGDEAFAGYNEYVRTFNNLNKYRFLSFVPYVLPFYDRFLPWDSNFRQQAAKLAAGYKDMGMLIRNNFRDPLISKLLKKEYQVSDKLLEEQAQAVWHSSSDFAYIGRMQRYDYNMYLEPDILVKVDRATMAHSIEVRSPFLDYRLVELAASIPPSHNINGYRGKMLLRNLLQRYLPKNIYEAPKRGFGLPIAQWLNKSFRENLYDEIIAEMPNFFNHDMLAKILKSSARRDLSAIVWRLWILYIWYITCHRI
jgi:asparagine synthase (glutamine-hydrolysing)